MNRLEHDEIRQMVAELAPSYSFNPGEFERLHAELDKDGDGEIDAAEFIAWWQDEKRGGPVRPQIWTIL